MACVRPWWGVPARANSRTARSSIDRRWIPGEGSASSFFFVGWRTGLLGVRAFELFCHGRDLDQFRLTLGWQLKRWPCGVEGIRESVCGINPRKM